MPETDTMPPSESAASTVQKLLSAGERQLREGRFKDALQSAEQALAESPGSIPARYLHAVSLRYLGRHEAARESLDLLIAMQPEYGRAYQEMGHLAVAKADASTALRAFQQAVQLNPALLASWQSLQKAAEQLGQDLIAGHASREAEFLLSLPPEVRSARSMLHEGKLFRAERLCRDFLEKYPTHVEGMRVLAALGLEHGILDDAQFLLESALKFEPENLRARLDLITVLYRRQRFSESMEQAAWLYERFADDLRVVMAYANQSTAVGNFEKGISLYRSLIEKASGDPTLHLTQGHALKTVSRVDEAIESYRSAYRARPDFGDAYWSLANLKTYAFLHQEVEAMHQWRENRSTSLEDRIHLSFALGKHYETGEAWSTSFQYYAEGNALRRKQLGYDNRKTSERLERQRQFFSKEFLASVSKDAGCQSADPIFVVGLPRAGSTLIEQILASHSQIDGTLELQNITSIAQKIDGRRKRGDAPRYPYRLADMEPSEWRLLGERYLEETQVHREGAPFFVDKLPNNFVHVGLIHLILPNAKVIDARRHPMGCCFSNFTQLFASGQEYTYGLEDLGVYYNDYLKLMAHWDDVLPGKVLRVHYEDVTQDLETQVRRMLDFCGLPFESSCLDFHQTQRSVRTPSSEQVRQPIYQQARDHWRRFEASLTPLKQHLGDALESYPELPKNLRPQLL